jgi:hypothetical protein
MIWKLVGDYSIVRIVLKEIGWEDEDLIHKAQIGAKDMLL